MHSANEILEEEKHFAKVIATFRNYAPYSIHANNRRRKDLYTLPLSHRELLSDLGYKKKLDEVDAAIMANAKFLNSIVDNPEIFGHDTESEEPKNNVRNVQDAPQEHVHDQSGHSHSHSGPSAAHSHSHESHARVSKEQPTEFDMDKLRSTLKQFVREWSIEGQQEREKCYGPMKKALLEHFSDIPFAERRNFRVLVPGAGLARLAFDVANLGFTCQGNEFSHYMLLPSYFILNRTEKINQHTIYPYVHSFSNVPNHSAMMRSVSIPDVLPSGLPPGSNFSLVAGDFEEIYGSDNTEEAEPQAGLWDAILTCFFIDTAKDIVNYLRIIHRILAPGGIWINAGPLLWHWENNNTNDPSVELDLDELKELMQKMGFEIANETTIDTTYTNNSQSMLDYIYHAAFWTATKKI